MFGFASAMRAAAKGLAALCLILSGWPAGADPDPRLVSIHTGDRDGVYYYAGGTLCGLLNADRWAHGIRCIVRKSGGSIENLHALRRGDATFAIVQSDWQHHALNGTDVFESRGTDRALRSVLSLYPESFTVLARATSGITRFSELEGKRISIGPVGSGGRGTMETLMGEMGWSASDFAFLADFGVSDLEEALCSGDIDAAVMVIGHPNLAVEALLSACDLVLVPVGREVTDGVTESFAYYFRYGIPSGTYPGQSSSVDTFALAATLVTNASTHPIVVRQLVRALFEALPQFQSRHPAFAEFTAEQMLTEGLTAPMHLSARRYFEEAGFLPGPD